MKYAEILYRLAIALWVGGSSLFTFVLTPLLFKTETRDTAGRIVGTLFPGYFRWGLACGGIALICRIFLKGGKMELATGILLLMLAATSFQAFYIEPKAAEIKRQIVSFETTPKDDPFRKQFSKLHGVSAVCNLAVVAGGVVLVILM